MLLGRKIGMTQVFQENGTAVAVTVVQAGPCVIMQKKEAAKNGGVNAVQLGFEALKEKHAAKPQLVAAKKAGLQNAFRFVRDMKVNDLAEYQIGQELTVSMFEPGQFVDAIGTSRGMGFQGVIKRHNFSGGVMTHGSMFHRAPGSIGSSAAPSRVFKQMRMPGHMGNERVTVQNLKVIAVYPEDNLIAISGAIPGHDNSMVVLKPALKKLQRKNK